MPNSAQRATVPITKTRVLPAAASLHVLLWRRLWSVKAPSYQTSAADCIISLKKNIGGCRNGEPVVIDLGRDTYTSQTFGPQRYEMTNNRSLYHNVPVVNGYEQKDGRQYEGINVDHTYTDSASIMLVDIAKAYPKEAGVKSWVRRLTLDRHFNRVEITEHIIMKDNQGSNSTDITLMCYGSPRSVQKGRVGGCRWQIKNYLFFLNSEGATPYSSLKHFEK